MTSPAKTSSPPHFPLALCLAALTVTGLGLAACVLGLQWGQEFTTTEILDRAWLYVNVSLALMTLLIWPAIALRTSTKTRPPQSVSWELCTLIAAAVPAMTIAAWLSNIPLSALLRMLALQLSFALLGLGLAAWRSRPRWHARLTALSLALTLGLPMLAYIQAEFAPAAARTWFFAAPLLTVYEITDTTKMGGTLWGLALLWSALGIALLLLGVGRAQE